jgi:putative heme-binding domain-containing protein
MRNHRRRRAWRAAALVWLWALGSVGSVGRAEEMAASLKSQVDAGKELFATACANCHGAAGKGGIGPALADRNLAPELIRTTVLSGRVGTPMPPFKDQLDLKSQEATLAYVQWLTSGGHLPTSVISLNAQEGADPSASTYPSAQPVAVGPETGTPARGAALFFDPTRIYSCRACHSFRDKGGPVGPDLSGIDKTPLEIYRSITRPRMATDNLPAILIELRDGTRSQGIQGKEDNGVVQFFDISSIPPVKRSVLRSEIRQVSRIKGTGIYDHRALPYSKQDFVDLSAYLGETH